MPGVQVEVDADGLFAIGAGSPSSGDATPSGWTSTDGATWTRLSLTGSTTLPKIGYYDAQGAQGMYVTGATVLPDRIVVSGYGNDTYALWLATPDSP